MKISGVRVSQKPNFKSGLTPADLAYKQKLIKGIQQRYQFTPKVESLKSVVAPDELKALLKKFAEKHFKIGKRESEFESAKNGSFRVNLHSHTRCSDGFMSPIEFLEQSKQYADKVAKFNHEDGLPAYTTAVTDHNDFKAGREIIAQIAEEPEKYKNLKFVAGCEFMFLDKQCGFPYTAFELVGLGVNPYNVNLINQTGYFNPIDMIPLVKEDGAVLSYAHPARFLQGNGVNPEFIEYLKKIGVDGIESNYQYVNIKPSKELQDSIDNIRRVALENNFYETGGTDTHSKNIFFAGCDNYLDVLG